MERSVYDEVVRKVSKETRCTYEQIKGRDRFKTICAARRRVWRLLKDMGWSFPEIGRAAGRDHTTILTGVRQDRKEHPDLGARDSFDVFKEVKAAPLAPQPVGSWADGFVAGIEAARKGVAAYLRLSDAKAFPRDHRHADVVERGGYVRKDETG